MSVRRLSLLKINYALLCVLALTLTVLAAVYMPRTDALGVEVTLPDLVGTVYTEGDERLSDVALYELSFDYRADAEHAPGTVLAQYPPALSVRRALPGRSPVSVRLTLSTGPKAFTLPPLIGRDAHEAALYLQAQGLTVRVRSAVRNELKPGQVISVSPPEGSEVHEGEVVTLTRSEVTTARTVRVPDVTGVAAAQANTTLVLRGLRPSEPSYEYSDRPTGTVISQRPLPGTLVPAGSRATLVISRGGAAEQELEMETGE